MKAKVEPRKARGTIFSQLVAGSRRAVTGYALGKKDSRAKGFC
jgi:hypothetical protein